MFCALAQVFFWNAVGARPSGVAARPPPPATGAKEKSLRKKCDRASILAVAAAAFGGGGAAPSSKLATQGHHLPVLVYGNHDGMLCIVVPRPNLRGMYNKLFFSRDELRGAMDAAVTKAKAATVTGRFATAKGDHDYGAPRAADSTVSRGGGLRNVDLAPECPHDIADYIFGLEKIVLTKPVGTGAGVGFTGAADEETDGTLAKFEKESVAARGVNGIGSGNGDDGGLRLKLKGVNAFSTCSSIDERAASDLTNRIGGFAKGLAPAVTDPSLNAKRFEAVRGELAAATTDSENARAALGATLEEGCAVIQKLSQMHEADTEVRARLPLAGRVRRSSHGPLLAAPHHSLL